MTFEKFYLHFCHSQNTEVIFRIYIIFASDLSVKYPHPLILFILQHTPSLPRPWLLIKRKTPELNGGPQLEWPTSGLGRDLAPKCIW